MTSIQQNGTKPMARKRGLRRPLWRILAPLIFVLVILAGLLGWVSWIPLVRSREAWRAGRNAEAIEQAEHWAGLHLWQAEFHQLLAAEYLSVGNDRAAQPHLAALSGRTIWLPVVRKAEVAQRLFARGRYAEYLAFDGSWRSFRESRAASLDRAAALTALNRLTEAEAVVKPLDPNGGDAKKIAALNEAIAQRKSGVYPVVFDRDGRVIASYDMANQDLIAVNRDFQPLIDRSAGALTIGSQLQRLGVNDSIETTLDPAVQHAAVAALGGFRGSLVAIDPRTNEILAVASTRANGQLENLAFEKQYEPGSVIKVLTGLNALSSGVDVGSMFPYDCKGELMIDGRHFGDWLPAGHGVLPSIDDALAVSCNVAFADIGLRLGADRLRQFMGRAGFDGQTNIGLYQVPLGRFIPPVFNRFETAFMAIGLKHESITPLHVAILASMMANHGVLTNPRLLRQRRSILGDVVQGPSQQTSVTLAPPPAAAQMIEAMKAVVTNPRGTGKRAEIDGLPIAMKTGTAGDRTDGGLQAVICAFAPADNPKIAFGMIAEDAGPAEFAGAKIARDFLVAIQPRLK